MFGAGRQGRKDRYDKGRVRYPGIIREGRIGIRKRRRD